MNVGDNRNVAVTSAQTVHDVFQIARILHRGRGDAHNLASYIRQLDRLLNRRFGVHRVASDHRLDANRIIATNAELADAHFAGDAPPILQWIFAIAHWSGWIWFD